jgi:hypothetical protein
MKIKPQPPRSCLGWFAWVFGILLAFILLSNVYAQVRLAIARTQAEALARELGYTPDDLLLFRTDINNVDIVTGSAKCNADLYFVTPLGFDEFEAKLMQARPGTQVNPGASTVRYWAYLPVDTYEANGNKVEDKESLPPVLKMTWFVKDELYSPTVGAAELYETEHISLPLKYGERPIEDNIAVITWLAGRYPMWVVCF